MYPAQRNGRNLRLHRLSRAGDGRYLIVPLDHFVTEGPNTAAADIDSLVGDLSGAGVDAVVLHKGSAKRVRPESLGDMELVLHLSASTIHAADPDAKYLVATVEEALYEGATAVSVHVNLGSDTERQQVADLARVAGECSRWNMPLLAMVYPRGPQIANPRDPALIAHAAQLAADLGADIVKVPACQSQAEMRDVAASCPIPLVTAGGPFKARLDALLDDVSGIVEAGAAGVAMGRNIFLSPDPAGTARAVQEAVHRPVRALVATHALASI